MKKWVSLLLILALTVPALTSCRRGQKSDAPEATATPQPGGGGPGYTITDSDTVPSVPDPLSTLTPQERAAITVGANGGDVTEELLPPGGDQQPTADPNAYEPPPMPVETDEELDTYDEAAEAARNVPAPINSSAYQYASLADESVDFTFNYPSQWENVPGIYTVCFREKVEKGEFPARVAISRKKLVHTPDEIVMNE